MSHNQSLERQSTLRCVNDLEHLQREVTDSDRAPYAADWYDTLPKKTLVQ
jgi:hypothetical protein